MRLIVLFVLFSMLAGCGTLTPMPAPGGGKRFAIEQILVSAVAKQAIADIPTEVLRGSKATLDVSVMYDEGGGFINGGRPYLNETLSHVINGAGNTNSRSAGVSVSRDGGGSYGKDLALNNSDSRQFVALLVSSLFRQNILVNPELPPDQKVDYAIEVFVDVLGTIRSRTDWFLRNSETLKAVVSLEYVITPINPNAAISTRKVGRIAYEATYNENYMVWMGPTDIRFDIRRSELADIIPTLGAGVQSFENVRRDKKDLIPPMPVLPTQIVPAVR